jgi:hypothetical protein
VDTRIKTSLPQCAHRSRRYKDFKQNGRFKKSLTIEFSTGAKVDIRKEGSSNEDCVWKQTFHYLHLRFRILFKFFSQVSYAEGVKLSKKVGPFLECSAKTGENLRLVFQEAVRAALNKPKTKPRNCNIL